jgi:hypothetical protein
MKKLLLAAALILGTVSANAASKTSDQAWNCSFGFSGTSTGLKVLVGFYHFNGKGSLQCVSDQGETANYPVTIRMNALPISPAISLGVMKMNARALDFRLVGHNPQEIFGTYSLLQGQVAIVGGAGVVTAIHDSEPRFALKLALQFARGLGVNLGLNKMHIELDRSGSTL